MNLLQSPAPIAIDDLHVSNNAAFDDEYGQACNNLTSSPLRPALINGSVPPEIDPVKENRGPVRSVAPAVAGKKAARVAFKEREREVDDDDTDEEIGRIRREIERLSSRLDRLQTRRAEREVSNLGVEAVEMKRGRVVQAKFMEPKPAVDSRAFDSFSVGSRSGRRGMSLGPSEIFDAPGKVPWPKSSTSKRVGNCGDSQSKFVSLGPVEIIATPVKTLKKSPVSKKVGSSPAVTSSVRRRGVSLGPMEILGQVDLGRSEKPKGTPFRAVQGYRKGSSLKLGGIEEEDESGSKSRPSLATKDRVLLNRQENAKIVRARRRGLSLGPSDIVCSNFGARNKLQDSKPKVARVEKGGQSLSVSPKPRRASIAKALELRNGIATVGSQKIGRTGDMEAMADLKPKALFQDSVKRPLKSIKARVVPSRYSLAPLHVSGDESGKKQRKWSLPGVGEKKKEVMMGSSDMPDCEIDEEFEQQNQIIKEQEENLDEGTTTLPAANSPLPIAELARKLPRIKQLRCTVESPRDSGCVKRASQMVGRKSPFALEEEGEELASMNQILNFQE